MLRSIEERNKLVMEYDYLPITIINKFGRYSTMINKIGFEDAKQIGFLTLIKAAARWNPEKGPFSNYAYTCIKTELLREKLYNGIIKLPRTKGIFTNPSKKLGLTKSLVDKVRNIDSLEGHTTAKTALTQNCDYLDKVIFDETQSRYDFAIKFVDITQKTILDLKKDGKSFSAIGKIVGLSKSKTVRLYNAAIDTIRKIAA